MKQNKQCQYPQCAQKEEYCCYFRCICSAHHAFEKAHPKK